MGRLKDLLTNQGFNETDIDKITQAVADSGYMPEGAIPKARLDEVIAQKKNLEEQIGNFDKQISELKKSAGDNEELKKQIETLKEDNKRIAKEGEEKIKEFYKSTAIKNAFADRVHSADVVYGMLDTSKIVYDEKDKKVLAGLEEQLATLKESNAWLFKEDKPMPAGSGYVPQNGNATPPPQEPQKSNAVLRAERLAQKNQ